MRILVRGGGDLASGIVIRLYNAGHEVIITEIETPLTVRREVAFSKAVYEKECTLEGITCIRVYNEAEIEQVLAEKKVALIVDSEAEIRHTCHPDVLVDATIAKRNLGTTIHDAPLVICVGPGFTAQEDCHCVIESNRGPHLGRVYWKGSAIPNTGVPGNVAGYTIERLIKASADGVFEAVAHIGDFVKKDDVIAYSGGQPIYALMSGCIRGMLQDGVVVQKGLKVGDIDARLDKELCVLVSDKARAIGGGVLEAITAFEHGVMDENRNR